MFTNKYSRRGAAEQPSSQSRNSKYIEPFAERDTEQPSETNQNGRGFMAELDRWLDEMVFEPIERAIEDEDSKELHIAFAESKQHIKRKVLASYHNGLKAKSAAINHNTNDKPHYRRN